MNPQKMIRAAWARVRDLPYWLRTHTINRYHLIDIRDKGEGHGYRWGWIDRDEVMLLACFTVLRDFVEKEKPFGRMDSDKECPALAEIKDLYEWWMRGRKAEHDAVHDTITAAPLLCGLEDIFAEHLPPAAVAQMDDHYQRLTALDDKDDAQLLRLMAVRRFLWT